MINDSIDIEAIKLQMGITDKPGTLKAAFERQERDDTFEKPELKEQCKTWGGCYRDESDCPEPLKNDIQIMKDYLLLKFRLGDMHGVSDAATDIREMEARGKK